MRRSILILLLLTGHFSTGSALYAVQPGQSMPDRNLLTLDGSNRLHLADLKGYVVYVDFWASWCTPCRLSLPDLEKLYRRYYGDGFRVIAITVDEHTEDAEAFLALHRVIFSCLSELRHEHESGPGGILAPCSDPHSATRRSAGPTC